LEKGAARVGRGAANVKVMVSPLVATGPSPAAVREARETARQLLAFLYSTPAYWPSLELFGWKDRGERLHQLGREGHCADTPGLVSDEMLDALVPMAPYGQIADLIGEWYAPLTDWIAHGIPADAAVDVSLITQTANGSLDGCGAAQ
jgi:alkanesulfonate monooxygenase SsuD/methylene tetrahydromethanopterin reductase-like flavin-dependent oxidoreductase (luciferase family)